MCLLALFVKSLEAAFRGCELWGFCLFLGWFLASFEFGRFWACGDFGFGGLGWTFFLCAFLSLLCAFVIAVWWRVDIIWVFGFGGVVCFGRLECVIGVVYMFIFGLVCGVGLKVISLKFRYDEGALRVGFIFLFGGGVTFRVCFCGFDDFTRLRGYLCGVTRCDIYILVGGADYRGVSWLLALGCILCCFLLG